MGDFKGGGGGGFETSGLEQAAQQAQAIQEQIQQQTREDVKPWYETGAAGIGQLGTLLGLQGEAGAEGYGSLMQSFGPEQFQEDPGYQFRQQQGQQALERAMGAQGVTLGGGGFGEVNPQVAQALQEQSQGLASQEYGAAYDRYGQDQQNIFNRLMGVSGAGERAAGGMAQAGQAYGTNVGNIQMGLAGAQSRADIARASQPSMFDKLIGPAIQMASDRRLKENVALVGNKNGHNIYEFDYKDGSGRFRGVMAQEVQRTNPEAVAEMDNGYLGVFYDKIGLKMERVHGV